MHISIPARAFLQFIVHMPLLASATLRSPYSLPYCYVSAFNYTADAITDSK